METILGQLKNLLIEAGPTVVLIYAFYLFLKFNLFRPLEKVLAERELRTEGARKLAEQAKAEAKEKTQAYADALRRARAAIYAEQEVGRRSVLRERESLIRETRNRATEEVRAAREQIGIEMAQARQEMERESVELGVELGRAMLQRRPGDGTPSGMGR